MLEKIKNIFLFQKRNSEEITDFADAVSWVKTYKKALNFDTAVFATRELTLKTKSWLNYYEEVLKKLTFSEASNIEKIAEVAALKKKKVEPIISMLYKRLDILDGLLREIEKEKKKEDDAKHTKVQLEKFDVASAEITECIEKKEFTRALSFAKKLVADFPNEKRSVKVLTKTQKIHDAQKTKAQKEEEKHEKISKIFKEIGIEMNELKNKKGQSLVGQMRLYFKKIRLKNVEKQEYVTRQRALKSIEELLVKSGTIDNVGEENRNEELFSIMNSGLSKDLDDFSLQGFDFYGKILGKDKIVGDTFGYYRDGNKSVFYFGDATGHGVQAGFTVALLSKIFFEFSKKIHNFQDLFRTLNNELKAKIKGRFFITSVFFELDITNNQLHFIGAWHDPMFLYRKSTNTVEKIIPGGLALWVRLIQNVSSIKLRDMVLENGDVLFGYTDGIIETKDSTNVMYSLNRLEKSFWQHAQKLGHVPDKLFAAILKDVNDFRGSIPFEDDVSMFIFSRNSGKDLIGNKAELESILKEMDVKKWGKEVNFKNKTRQQIIEELKKERYERDLKIRLDRLDRLYKMAEFTKLKQEVYLYFREWFAHDRMRFYLEKALENEQKSIVKKQEEKLMRKYETLTELYKKWEYEVVVKEVIDVLFKNGKV